MTLATAGAAARLDLGRDVTPPPAIFCMAMGLLHVPASVVITDVFCERFFRSGSGLEQGNVMYLAKC